MDALAVAAAEHLNRDALWKESPPLADGCDHERELLPITEFRVTVACRACGGLDKETSRRIQRWPMVYTYDPDGWLRMGTTRVAKYERA